MQRILISAAVAASTACALLSFSAADKITDYLSLRTDSGMVFSIHIAETERKFLNAETAEAIRRSYGKVEAAAAVNFPTWERIEVDGVLYSPRKVLAVGAEYAGVVGLTMAAGRFLHEEGSLNGTREVVISEEAATMLYGGADAAVGMSIRRHYRELGGLNEKGATEWHWTTADYRVIGVFRAPAPILSHLYEIGEFIEPIGREDSANPVDSIFVRVEGNDEAEAREVLLSLADSSLGAEDSVSIYLGRGEWAEYEIRHTSRETTRITLFFATIAVIALGVAGIGLSAAMTAETLAREHETGLRRAVGATNARIVGTGALNGFRRAAAGIVIGTAGAAAAAPTVLNAVFPILYAERAAFETAGISLSISPESIALTCAVTVLAAMLSGAVPAFSMTRGRPAEQLSG